MKIKKLDRAEQGLKYPELIKFIKEHGKDAFPLDDKETDKLLDHYASIKRLFLMKDPKGRLAGIACGNHISDPWFAKKNELPEEDPSGRILFIMGIVIHNSLRHRKVMKQMLENWVRVFPHLWYIMYKRYYRDNEYKVIPIRKIVKQT